MNNLIDYFSISYLGDILTTAILTCIVFVIFFILDELTTIFKQLKNNKNNSQNNINQFTNIIDCLRTGRILFEDNKLNKAEITTLVELNSGDETIYMVILNNDLTVIHNIIFKNNTIHVKKFRLVFFREKPNTLNDLAEYINAKTYFKLKSFHPVSELLKK